MKFAKLKCITAIALCTLLTSAAWASTTWYVNGVSGSNTNNCTSPTIPCKTIGRAISLAASGDTVRIAAATYKEHLVIAVSLRLIGSGATTTIIDGVRTGRVVYVANVSGSVVVILSQVTIRNGQAAYGGGVLNTGTLTINNSTISGNATYNGRSGEAGGGIDNRGTLTISNSTLSGNVGWSVPSYTAEGGGIDNRGTLTISNSTLSGNIAEYYGGGIANRGTVTISSSTLSGNTSSHTAGGGVRNLAGSMVLQNSIVANNSGENCVGAITSNGYNLSSDNTCNFSSTGDLNNTDPLLGALQNNGGPTQTMALPLGSTAVDAGNPTGCTDGLGHLLKTDQRGKPRPDAEEIAGCDIGAYEYQGAVQTGHCVYVCGSTRCGELTGYCSGSVGGVCRQSYDPVHCPAGQPARGTATNSCGVGIDPTRTCTP